MSRATTAFRARAPVITAFLDRPTDALDVGVFLATVGVGASLAMYGLASAKSVAAFAVTLLSAAQVSLFVFFVAWCLRAGTRRALDAAAYPVATTLVVVALAIDRVHYGFFHQHLSRAVCAQAFDAIRAKALRVEPGAVGTGVASAIVLTALLAVLLKGLSFIPRPHSAPLVARGAALPLLLALGTASSLRECVLDPPSKALLPIRSRVPWDGAASFPTDAPGTTAERAQTLFGDARPFEEARRHGAELLASPPRPRSRPDIVFVHVESLRYDMLREDVAPRLSAFAKECLSTPFHYTTGTNTGTGVFGLLNGMTSPYYPLARAAHAHPIPIQLLRSLGYGISVFFTSNFGTYDGLYDLYFGGLADFTYHGPEQPVYDADAKMVESYIARLRAPGPDAPRFDYLVLDSTHYDYSYPPGLEKFKPAMTLDLGIRDGIVAEDGINDRLKWRAPYVRNRYQNSVLWADSLVGKMIDALRETQRLDRTIVVITGDHGEEFWEHGSFGHGFFTLSNEQSRVPFLMHLPGGGSSSYRYSSHADVFPTIFDSMGLEPEVSLVMNGKSLLRYEPSLDDAVVGFGIARDFTDARYAVIGEGLKVYWRNVPPFDVSEILTDADDPVLPLPSPAQADELVFRAVAQKAMR